jgi:hypothetical protein
MSRFSVAKEKVLDDLEAIVEQLLRASRKHLRGGLWNVANPYRPKSKPEQMVVWLRDNRRGAWKDFVSGDKGDAIDLVAFGLTGDVNDDSRMAAVEWVEDRYGLRNMAPARREQLAAEASARRKAAEAKELNRRESSIARARKFFYSCREDVAGTPTAVYLASRHAGLDRVQHLGRSLRYRPDCEYWMLDGRPRMPAMVSAMVDQGGRIGACHYTFLQPDGSDKADVPKAKLMFPETGGLVIRLTNGASGLSAEDAATQGTPGLVGLVEGIEDGLSAAIAFPELRMWSAGSLGGFGSVPDHACVSGWIVFKDNDWGKRQAQQQFDRAIARLKSFRKPVEVVSMPAEWGKDVNDAIRSGW